MQCTKFFCFYCLNPNDFTGAESFNGSIVDVYGHWFDNHENESLSKPFRFYPVTTVGCIHCNNIGTYHDLVKHHNVKHSDQQFAIVNRIDRKKCGLCHFRDGDLIEHFRMKHELKQMSKLFNPIQYTEEKIFKLLTISVNKKHQCNGCDQVFETRNQIAEHFKTAHNGQMVQSTEFVDNHKMPIYVICGNCHKSIEYTRFLSHFREESYNFPCKKCSYQSNDMSELIFHEKIEHDVDSLKLHCESFPAWVKQKFLSTDMVFGNGLTLKAYNVLETKFDDSKLFDIFIAGFVDLKREQAKKKIEMIETSENTPNCSTFQSQAVPVELSVPQTRPTVVSNEFHLQNENILQSPSESIEILELNKQQTLAKNVYVHGISRDLNITDLYGIFLKLCRMLGVFMTRASIESIVQCEYGLVARFHQMTAKKRIMSHRSELSIWISDLVPLHNDQTPRKVKIKNHMTPFYSAIHKAAAKFKRQVIVYSAKLDDTGFVIKMTANGTEHIVQSKQQLIDLVVRYYLGHQ